MNTHEKMKKPLNNQKGFTLIEIIAVLVILGILAAVAIPRYFDLQNQARQKAMEGALGEATGVINSYFADRLLRGDQPNAIVYNDANLGTNLGDFILSTSNVSANTLELLVTGRVNTALSGSTSSRQMRRPGLP